MATRKQRRRRAKERRHEWEYVLVDEEGREVPLEEDRKARGETEPAKAGGPGAAVRAPGGRVIEPPSWGRVLKRAGIFGPLILVVVYLLRPKGAGLASVIMQAVILLAFFIPFSYLMDSLMYRMARKRAERARTASKGR